jgi:hypothetical protein
MHYRLTVEDDNEQQVENIGTFDSEKALAEWAKENPDTLSQYKNQ